MKEMEMMTNLVPNELFNPDVDELFRGFFAPVRWKGAPAPITIKMDVTETAEGYLVHAEIPGVDKKDINVEIEGNQVTITGEVKREREKKEGDKVLRSERYYGERLSQLHAAGRLDEAKCEAKYTDGVLESAGEPQPRRAASWR
jgi:HSP20 family protein